MRRLTSLVPALIATLCAGTASAQMKAHVINVGQAESILLEFTHAAVLVDAGGEVTGDDRDRDHLLGYLDAFFARRADLGRTLHTVIVSHPHIDHTRHLNRVFERFAVKNFVDGGDLAGSGFPQLRTARRNAGEKGINYLAVRDSGITRDGFQPPFLAELAASSGVDLRFLGGARPECEDGNNGSLVLLVTYREATFLLPGDSEDEDPKCTPQIRNVLARYDNGRLDVDVYKVSHHGSHNGTSVDFLKAMSPEIAVISAGVHQTQRPGNFHGFQFGHPREAAVAMIEAATTGTRPHFTAWTMSGARQLLADRAIDKAIYCTCWDGDIVIEVDETGTKFDVRTTPVPAPSPN
ncbi:MAG TPA: MBL fold metallo-hydrolase [Longimicrobium sp.]|nr:MBL fold metallo-hydrolase [Longimicrobium sp.]